MYGNQKGVTFREIKSCQYYSHFHYIKDERWEVVEFLVW